MENNYSVYYHYNKINGKYYVGITKQEPTVRWNKGYGYIKNKHFFSAIKKYGWDNFEHVVIETGLSVEMAVALEKRLIKECDSYKHGYNQSLGGESVSGYRMSEETKQKIREANSGEKSYWYGKKIPRGIVEIVARKHINHPTSSKQINQYNLNGEYINTYPSIAEARRKYGNINIERAIKTCGKTGKYMWRYYTGNTNDIEPYCKYENRKTKPFEPVIQFDLQGCIIGSYFKREDLVDAGYDFNLVYQSCTLRHNTAQGYIWRFFNEERGKKYGNHYMEIEWFVKNVINKENVSCKKVVQFDINGNFIKEYNSVKQVHDELNVSCNVIVLCCKGKKKTAKDSIWCYADELNSLSKKIAFANKPNKKCRIRRYTLDGVFIDEFSGIKPAVKQLGFGTPCVIDACCFGMIDNAFGYIWRYAE